MPKDHCEKCGRSYDQDQQLRQQLNRDFLLRCAGMHSSATSDVQQLAVKLLLMDLRLTQAENTTTLNCNLTATEANQLEELLKKGNS